MSTFAEPSAQLATNPSPSRTLAARRDRVPGTLDQSVTSTTDPVGDEARKTYSSVYPWLFSLGFFMASQGITFVVVSPRSGHAVSLRASITFCQRMEIVSIESTHRGFVLDLSGCRIPRGQIPASLYRSLLIYCGNFMSQAYPLANCQAAMVVFNSFYPLSTGCTSLLFFFRVRAIYGGQRIISWIFAFLWICVVGAAILVPIYSYAASVGSVCIVTKIPSIVGAAATALTVHDTSVFMIRALFRGANLHTFSMALFRDGQMYYMITILSNILTISLVYAPSVSPIYHGVMGIPNVTLTSIMACRVYRNAKLHYVHGESGCHRALELELPLTAYNFWIKSTYHIAAIRVLPSSVVPSASRPPPVAIHFRNGLDAILDGCYDPIRIASFLRASCTSATTTTRQSVPHCFHPPAVPASASCAPCNGPRVRPALILTAAPSLLELTPHLESSMARHTHHVEWHPMRRMALSAFRLSPGLHVLCLRDGYYALIGTRHPRIPSFLAQGGRAPWVWQYREGRCAPPITPLAPAGLSTRASRSKEMADTQEWRDEQKEFPREGAHCREQEKDVRRDVGGSCVNGGDGSSFGVVTPDDVS
ncbi:hypothetical protein B0H14DRAFT_3887554 [Mycena olivaceomarginata]|nr:hypothetical protein B0H14DRAFT_3887554 [Mycena olivaceomarginata]